MPEPFFNTMGASIIIDGEEAWFARMTMIQPAPIDLAPRSAAAMLRHLADRLDDLAKAEALGLPREIALQLAGLKPGSSGGAA